MSKNRGFFIFFFGGPLPYHVVMGSTVLMVLSDRVVMFKFELVDGSDKDIFVESALRVGEEYRFGSESESASSHFV